jgi:hypothetical protein
MSQSTSSPPAPGAPNEFDAAKSIVEALKGLEKQQQVRAVRFASEHLGLNVVTPAATAVPISDSQVHPPPSSLASTSAHPASSRTKDIKQFTVEKSPKSDQQFAAVVAYNYRFQAPDTDRRETISPTDLIEAARLVGRPRPPSPSMTLTNAKNAGYLDSAGHGAYRLNTVGENLVAVTLPGDGSEQNARSRPAKKKKPIKKDQLKARTKTKPSRPETKS